MAVVSPFRLAGFHRPAMHVGLAVSTVLCTQLPLAATLQHEVPLLRTFVLRRRAFREIIYHGPARDSFWVPLASSTSHNKLRCDSWPLPHHSRSCQRKAPSSMLLLI